MGYFSEQDRQLLADVETANRDELAGKLLHLHKRVFEQLAINDIDLNIVRATQNLVTDDSVSYHERSNCLSVQYLRARGQAVTVEKLMGREETASLSNIITRLHPVIEMRLFDAGFAVEYILSPDAWWDQQNLKGKLSVPRYRQQFYSMLMALGDEYCMGFWQGIHLTEMRINGRYFQHPRILDEWLSTFHPHADWFRLGTWYEFEDDALTDAAIVETVFERVQALFQIYTFFLWTGDNNFREFVT